MNSEWTSLDLKKNNIDFKGALEAHLEHNNGTFICLTFKLANGEVVRIRKNDYSTSIEAQVVPTVTKYIVKMGALQSQEFDTEKQADEFNSTNCNGDAEVIEMVVPVPKQKTLLTELPF